MCDCYNRLKEYMGGVDMTHPSNIIKGVLWMEENGCEKCKSDLVQEVKVV